MALLPVILPSNVKKSGERKIPRLKEELYMDSAVVVCWPEVTWVMVSENKGKITPKPTPMRISLMIKAARLGGKTNMTNPKEQNTMPIKNNWRRK